jgi:hypothetical protein
LQWETFSDRSTQRTHPSAIQHLLFQLTLGGLTATMHLRQMHPRKVEEIDCIATLGGFPIFLMAYPIGARSGVF